MADYDEGQEPRRELTQDYYAGYYWGNDPYQSYDLPGRRSDNQLKTSIFERLETIGEQLDSIVISVHNGIVVLTGHVKTYNERRFVGQEVWRTRGVVKVLNELRVSEPETAGPSKILQEAA
jgi:osmotically-inducible protein OsmY